MVLIKLSIVLKNVTEIAVYAINSLIFIGIFAPVANQEQGML